MLKLSGYFLALATLALAIIGHVLFLEWEWLTGGTLGIGGIPPLSLFGYRINTPVRFYYLVWPIVLLVILIHRNLLDSRTGIAMRAMRDAPSAAAVLGVNIARLKEKVFISSAILGSFAGSLFAHYVSFVSVDSFGVDRSINFLLIAVLGGARTIAGPILGALFVTALPNLLSRLGDIHATAVRGLPYRSRHLSPRRPRRRHRSGSGKLSLGRPVLPRASPHGGVHDGAPASQRYCSPLRRTARSKGRQLSL